MELPLRNFGFIPFLLAAVCAALAGEPEPSRGTLVIEVDGLRSGKGMVLAAVFDVPDGFPVDETKSVVKKKGIIEGERSRIVFEALPHGDYAAAVLHDENDNERIDRHWYGLPREGYAVSNNIRSRLRSPAFDDAVFTHEADTTAVNIHIQYP